MINIKKIKIYIFVLIIINIFQVKAVAGYIEKINLKVTAEIAKIIFEVNHAEKISGNYSNIDEVPEYFFEIRNFNEENYISEIDFDVKLEALSQNKVEFEVINCEKNEVILNNNQKVAQIHIDKNNANSYKYKVVVKSNLVFLKDNLKILIDAKYFKKEIDIFDINIDKRDLEYEIFISNANKKYTNNDVILQIKCNKEIKEISGFELLENKTCLKKIYKDNIEETVIIEDYYNNRKNINISINNIDKIPPEILGITNNQTYTSGLKLIYKDNIGIKSIKVENLIRKQVNNVNFNSENKIIDNQFLVVNNNSINPYYLNQPGNYKITVVDFAENEMIKYITIK